MKRLEIKPEDRQKVQEFQKRQQSKVKLDTEHILIAEFGMMYGWQSMLDVINNKIDGETFTWMLEAGRRVQKQRVYDNARASFYGALSANTKKPFNTFKSIASKLLKESKADNE